MTSEHQDSDGSNNPQDTQHDLSSMSTLLSEHNIQDMIPKPGEMREGTIVRSTPTEILVDIGAKSEGVINPREVDKMDTASRDAMQVGQVISVCVEGNGDDMLVLSLEKANKMLAWQQVQQLHQDKTAHTVSITGFNRGGLVVEFGKLRGFMPASQVSRERRVRAVGDTPSAKWEDMVGEEAMVKIVEVDHERNRLIVSERAAFTENRTALREQLLTQLEQGQILKGQVTSLASFGAFVDIGGADGLVHVSEMSWSHVDHPSKLVQVGQEIEVQVLSVDPENKRISLSIKALEDNPWVELDKSYQVGQLVRGVITRITKFGAFALIEGNDKIEGLVHISEIADQRIEHPDEVVKEGEELTLRIITIDTQRQRLRLSIKTVSSADYADLDYEFHMAAERDKGMTKEDPTTGNDPDGSNVPSGSTAGFEDG